MQLQILAANRNHRESYVVSVDKQMHGCKSGILYAGSGERDIRIIFLMIAF